MIIMFVCLSNTPKTIADRAMAFTQLPCIAWMTNKMNSIAVLVNLISVQFILNAHFPSMTNDSSLFKTPCLMIILNLLVLLRQA